MPQSASPHPVILMKAQQSPQDTAFSWDMNTQFDFPLYIYTSKDTTLLLYTNFIIYKLEGGTQPLLLFQGKGTQNGRLGVTWAGAELSQMHWLEQPEPSDIVDGSV